MTVVCDAGTTPRPPQPPPSLPSVPSVLPAGPLRHARPSPSVTPTRPVRHARRSPLSVIPAGCKRESMVSSPPTKADMRRPTTPTRPAPGSRPVPLDSRLRGNDSRVRRGDHPTTTPAPSVTPVGHLPSFPPVTSSFPPVPSIIPASPPSVIPAGCKRESMVFSPPTKADMRRTSTPNTAGPWLPTRASGFPLSRE